MAVAMGLAVDPSHPTPQLAGWMSTAMPMVDRPHHMVASARREALIGIDCFILLPVPGGISENTTQPPLSVRRSARLARAARNRTTSAKNLFSRGG
jgi:hypothetical protein